MPKTRPQIESQRARRLLRHYLRGSDIHCPACGYTLSGLDVKRCTECGFALRLVLASPRAGGLFMGTLGLLVWLCVSCVVAVGVIGGVVVGQVPTYSLMILPIVFALAMATDQWIARKREISAMDEGRRIGLIVLCWAGPMGALAVFFAPAILG